jgi:hypothetical protein
VGVIAGCIVCYCCGICCILGFQFATKSDKQKPQFPKNSENDLYSSQEENPNKLDAKNANNTTSTPIQNSILKNRDRSEKPVPLKAKTAVVESPLSPPAFDLDGVSDLDENNHDETHTAVLQREVLYKRRGTIE